MFLLWYLNYFSINVIAISKIIFAVQCYQILNFPQYDCLLRLRTFEHTLIFWPIGLNFFCGNSGNYYLSIASVKSMLWHLISSFGAFLVGKWLDRQNQTKKLAHIRVFLDYLLSQNPIPELSDPGPPPLNFLFTWVSMILISMDQYCTGLMSTH